MEIEKGQEILAIDLRELLQEVENGEFGDFTNDKYPTPKITLAQKFHELRQNVINGKYD